MNTMHSIVLGDWVNEKKAQLTAAGRPTLEGLAAYASEELGFKVNASNLAIAMKARGLETRRVSGQQSERLALLAENERVVAENCTLRHAIAKVLAAEYVPDDLKDYLFAKLPEELRNALVQTK